MLLRVVLVAAEMNSDSPRDHEKQPRASDRERPLAGGAEKQWREARRLESGSVPKAMALAKRILLLQCPLTR